MKGRDGILEKEKRAQIERLKDTLTTPDEQLERRAKNASKRDSETKESQRANTYKSGLVTHSLSLPTSSSLTLFLSLSHTHNTNSNLELSWPRANN